MINVKLPDGSLKEFPKGVSVREAAEAISASLGKQAVAGKVNANWLI